MINHSVDNFDRWPTDKVMRWLGFIQAGLSHNDVIDLVEELKLVRDITQMERERDRWDFIWGGALVILGAVVFFGLTYAA